MVYFLQTCGGDPDKIDDREGWLIFPCTESSSVQCKALEQCSYFLVGLCGTVNQSLLSSGTACEAAAWGRDHICLWVGELRGREMLVPGPNAALKAVPSPCCPCQVPCEGTVLWLTYRKVLSRRGLPDVISLA